jgi:dynein heavy chain
MLLDDHLVKVQAMIASPFAAPFKEQLTPWASKLSRLQSILENWLKCQSKWIYLEPIFGSDEIMNQIPKEGAAFRQTDAIWRAAMENTRRNPLLMTVADMPDLLENFQRVRVALQSATSSPGSPMPWSLKPAITVHSSVAKTVGALLFEG